MIRTNHVFRNAVMLLLCALCSTSFAQTIMPIAGKAKIEGKVKSAIPISQSSFFIEVLLPHNVTGRMISKTATVYDNGTFQLDLDIESDFTVFMLNTNVNSHRKFMGKLHNGKTTQVNIDIDKNGFVSELTISDSFDQNEFSQGLEAMLAMSEFVPNREITKLYNLTPKEFTDYVQQSIEERLPILNRKAFLSEELKQRAKSEFKLSFYTNYAFEYKDVVMNSYFNINQVEMEEAKVATINASYFEFLKELDLGNPKNLTYFSFYGIQSKILSDKTLNIPALLDQDLNSWIAQAKSILSDLVGFKKGEYFDILAANAYGLQMHQDNKPLTEQQIKNIKDYWKDGEIGKILLRRNQQILNNE